MIQTMLSTEQAAICKALLARGHEQQELAIFFRVNGGRINDVAKGRRHASVQPARATELPSPEEVSGSWVIFKARQALLTARAVIDTMLTTLDA